MYCPKCGQQNDDNAYRCVACKEVIQEIPQPAPAPVPHDDRVLSVVMPYGHSGLSILASYLGLFSLLLIPAPFAIWASLAAMSDIKRNPKKHGWGRSVFGLIMGCIFTVVLVVWLIFSAMSS